MIFSSGDGSLENYETIFHTINRITRWMVGTYTIHIHHALVMYIFMVKQLYIDLLSYRQSWVGRMFGSCSEGDENIGCEANEIVLSL